MLAEIPDQVTEFMKKNGIRPRRPPDPAPQSTAPMWWPPNKYCREWYYDWQYNLYFWHVWVTCISVHCSWYALVVSCVVLKCIKLTHVIIIELLLFKSTLNFRVDLNNSNSIVITTWYSCSVNPTEWILWRVPRLQKLGSTEIHHFTLVTN